ncbi:MAG TPA: hypothetical protein VKA85_10760, partial [Candidatus Limnocylindrales bacterium]|nr:hypothetical protein [Candidatus Limnocylindrales bacterium]
MPASAFANQLSDGQTAQLPISSDAAGFECPEGDAAPAGSVLWHFIQTQVDAGTESGTLTVTFETAGTMHVESTRQTGGALHWYVTTGDPDTLTAAESDVSSEGNLVLSHICVGPKATPT